jgi:hypothetical protein
MCVSFIDVLECRVKLVTLDSEASRGLKVDM